MAVLTKPVSTGAGRMFDTGTELPTKGTFVATCIDVKDVYGVERRKFESDEMEKVDLTAFLFGYRDQDGKPYKISTKSMKISGNEKSALYGFLKSWLGKSPAYGWDYSEMKGKKALITVDWSIGRMGDREFANIITISPVPAGLVEAAPAAAAAVAANKGPQPTAEELAKAKAVAAKLEEEMPF